MTAEVKLEKKVYAPWACKENEKERARINKEIYEEIKEKAHCVGGKKGYGHNINYMVIDDHEYFADLENPNADKDRRIELDTSSPVLAATSAMAQ